MVIKVELADEEWRKKIGEVLSDIPGTIEIQNKGYNEEDNEVLIRVVSGSPEKPSSPKPLGVLGHIMRKKPPPPKPEEPKKPKEAPPPKPKEPEKPKPPPEATKEPKKKDKPKDAPKPPPPKPVPVAPGPVPIGHPPQPPVLRCWEWYEGYGGGPCWGGYGGPSGPCYGRPVYDSWGGGYWRPIYPSRCTDYICEENPNAACSIM